MINKFLKLDGGYSEMLCFNDSKCDDNKAPAIGGTCPVCQSDYTGDGSACVDSFVLWM